MSAAPPDTVALQTALREARQRLAALGQLQRDGRLVVFDYAYHPRVRDWSDSPSIRRLVARMEDERAQFESAMRMIGGYAADLRSIDVQPAASETEPHWANNWFSGLDGASLYALVASGNPATYLEVGSGNSTKFVRRAIRDHGLRTRVVSLDPHPRAEVDAICDEVIRAPLETADLALFDRLEPGDILFIDNSHRAFSNSDVTVFFTEVLGRLASGVVYGLHDIFLPDDYPADWKGRYYNEQYMLAAYLLGGGDGDTILLPCAFVSTAASFAAELDALWTAVGLEGVQRTGGAFWMRKS